MDTRSRGPLIPRHIIPTRSKESKIMRRFYEPLCMLRALGQTRGAHTRQPPSTDATIETRRRFLENLCYICDFTRGGESCTAIGLEERPDKYQFWVSSNDQIPKIVEFLNEALKFLYRVSDSAKVDLATVNHFIQFCADFAKSRIEGEQKLIQAQARECISKIQNRMTEADGSSDIIVNNTSEIHRIDSGNIIPVLQILINQKYPVRLCEFAHENRRSTWMTDLKALAFEDERELSPEDKRSPFFLVRHYIGRLSHHIRAPRQLLEDSFHMQHVLQTHTIMTVAPLAAIQPPLRGRHSNLRGIMNRMFHEHDVEKENVEAGLMHLHKITGLFDKFLTLYKRSDNCVHAEIKVLEHFYWSQLVFAGNDRFIACSKPACLCCELYFKHHPARIMTPSSHRKVWTNWSPPRVQDLTANKEMFILQRRVMSKITHDVREQVINQALQRTSQSPWHPDSRTGITESFVTGVQEISIEDQLSEASDIESGSDSASSSESERWSDIEDGGVPLPA
ncbi:hypothetical protein EIK77_002425 [Talaromyces pinophilus]|nr:hypothetical protein EIK77_002425 [Talaromyces pinophilus]